MFQMMKIIDNIKLYKNLMSGKVFSIEMMK